MKRHICITGNGKGKTSSAMGMAIRALAHGQKVAIGQFVKSRTDVGEYQFLHAHPNMVFEIFGKGFLPKIRDSRWEKHEDMARAGWEWAKIALTEGGYDLVILDEFHHILHQNMIDMSEVQEFWPQILDQTAVVSTGRYAPQALMELADTVSVIESPKHGYEIGIQAQVGLEY